MFQTGSHAVRRALFVTTNVTKRRTIPARGPICRRDLTSSSDHSDLSNMLSYLATRNTVELRAVTQAISRKIQGNPLEKYYIRDNKEVLSRLESLTNHAHPDIRFSSRNILYCVGVVPKSRPGIRVLSIDGGGTRGIIAISVLKKLEALTQRRVYELFDYCVGTSTGALLIAMLIANRRPLDEVLEAYLELSKEVFGGRSVLAVGRFVWKQYRYSTVTWEELLKRECSDWRMSDISCWDDSPLVAFVSTVVNHEVVHPYVFRSYDPRDTAIHRGGYDTRLWEAMRASTAAPSYFGEYEIGVDVHVDGGLLYNNPTALGLSEAKRVWPGQPTQCVVSIGTGRLPWQYRSVQAKPPSMLDTMNHLIAGATETETTHLTLNDLLEKDVYFRFNPPINEITPLDEINDSRLNNLISQTDTFINEHSEKFLQCSKSLLANSHECNSKWSTINKFL